MKKIETFSNGLTVSYDEKTGEVRIAQFSPQNKQTMPLDVVEEQDTVEPGETDLKVPRDESVGLKQTHPKEVKVYKYKFELGDNGSDTEIVPRSSNDDGVGGKKVTFEPEVADGYSSGDSDNYVQTLQKRPKPTPSGDPRNHAVVANEELMIRIAKLEKELKEAKRALTEERLLRGREKFARQIVNIEIEKGFFKPASEDEVETKVASYLKHPVDILENDLARVQSLPSVSASSKNNITTESSTIKKGFDAYGGLQTGAASLIPTNIPSYRNTKELYMASTRTGNIDNLAKELQKHTRLGDQFSEENIKSYESDPRGKY